MKSEMTVAQLIRAIEVTRPRITEATARAQRETAPHIVAMFTRNAAEARNELQVLEARLTAHKARANAVKVQTPPKPRCVHYKAIRTFMAIAREQGLDTANKKGMRAAFSALLGFAVGTRADLTGQQWGVAINALRAGLMWW